MFHNYSNLGQDEGFKNIEKMVKNPKEECRHLKFEYKSFLFIAKNLALQKE